jgi:hypothetical protein
MSPSARDPCVSEGVRGAATTIHAGVCAGLAVLKSLSREFW